MLGLLWALGLPVQILQDAVITGEDAYLVLSPECVAGTKVVQAQWSPDGGHIVLVRDYTRSTSEAVRRALERGEGDGSVPGKLVLASYSLKPRVYREIMEWDLPHPRVQVLGWFPKTDRAIVTIERKVGGETELGAFVVDAASGAVTELQITSFGTQVAFSPSEPLAVAFDSRGLVLFDQNGSKVKTVRLGDRLMGSLVVWGVGRTVPIAGCANLDGGGMVWFEWDLDSNSLRAVARPANQPEVVQPVYLEFSPAPGGRGSATLKSSAPSASPYAVISIEASVAQLTPKLDAVLYVSNGALFVRQILKIKKSLLEDLLAMAVQKEVMENAARIARGFQMFAADHDGDLPPSDDFRNQMDPYVATQKVLEGFVPTYSARSLKEIADPANTVLGFIETPRGRANVYANGSVRFVPHR